MRNAAVIMAGGSGTRLWPLSRRDRPKQFLRLFGGRSLLQLSCDRLPPAFDPRDIHVITLADQLPAVAVELPELPRENLIGEPAARDTANAIALSSAILHERDPETTMGVFTADHVIRPVETFAATVGYAMEQARQRDGLLITFGIRPTHPHTGYGYIEVDRAPAAGDGGDTQFESIPVRAFREKPDEVTARAYVNGGRHFWNSGMFVWKTATILDELRRHLPESYAGATEIARAWSSPGGAEKAASIYPRLPRISIDYAVMEKAASIAMIPMGVEWIDVGSWTALPSVLGADAAGNTVAAPAALLEGARDTIVVGEGDHLIAALGVKDLVIVRSADATLICRRDQIHRLKDFVEGLKTFRDGRFL